MIIEVLVVTVEVLVLGRSRSSITSDSKRFKKSEKKKYWWRITIVVWKSVTANHIHAKEKGQYVSSYVSKTLLDSTQCAIRQLKIHKLAASCKCNVVSVIHFWPRFIVVDANLDNIINVLLKMCYQKGPKRNSLLLHFIDIIVFAGSSKWIKESFFWLFINQHLGAKKRKYHISLDDLFMILTVRNK